MKKIILLIFSALLWIVWWTITILITLISLPIILFIPKKFYNIFAKILSKIFMYSALIFPRIKNNKINKLPFPVIFVSNHVSFFDLFISGSVLPGYPRGLELKKFFSLPVYGWLITIFGNIPIELHNYISVKNAFKKLSNILINKERSVMIMPEGKRTSDGKIDTFGNGAFHLSKKTGVPIVPVVYKGLFRINNRNSIIIKPGKFDVIIFNPVYPDKFKTENELKEYVRNLMIKKLNL